MTMRFLEAEELIREIVTKKINNDNLILHMGTKTEIRKEDILAMKLLDIQKMGRFAVC